MIREAMRKHKCCGNSAQNHKSKVRNRNNGDNLRSMNNEQLARYLWIETNRMTVEEWLDWLNREAK